MLSSGLDKSQPTAESLRTVNSIRFSSPSCLRPIEINICDGHAEQSSTFVIVVAVIPFNQPFMSHTRTHIITNTPVFKCIYIYIIYV